MEKGSRKGIKRIHVSIAREDLTEKAKFWFYFLYSVLIPSKHVCIVRQDKAILLYAILKGYKINFGKIIEKSIPDYHSNNFFGHIPHPSIIIHLCIKRGVNFYQEAEEKCPATPPLNFTSITKTSANKSKEKLKGVKKEMSERPKRLEDRESIIKFL